MAWRGLSIHSVPSGSLSIAHSGATNIFTAPSASITNYHHHSIS